MLIKIVEVLAVLVVLAAIIIILAYERLDRYQFRIERQWKEVWQYFLEWLDAVENLCLDNARILELGTDFRKTRRGRDKAMLADQILAESFYIAEDEELLAQRQGYWNRKDQLEQELAEFVQVYRELAGIFNKKLEGKLYGIVAKLLRIRSYPGMNHWCKHQKGGVQYGNKALSYGNSGK